MSDVEIRRNEIIELLLWKNCEGSNRTQNSSTTLKDRQMCNP